MKTDRIGYAIIDAIVQAPLCRVVQCEGSLENGHVTQWSANAPSQIGQLARDLVMSDIRKVNWVREETWGYNPHTYDADIIYSEKAGDFEWRPQTGKFAAVDDKLLVDIMVRLENSSLATSLRRIGHSAERGRSTFTRDQYASNI